MADGPLTHLDARGRARMVDVTGKPPTLRRALARCAVRTSAALPGALATGPDGVDAVQAARLAGMQAAKQTSSLIPLCHPVVLTGVEVAVTVRPPGLVEVSAETEVIERTGVEMEALTACTVAGLTLVQVLRAADPLVVLGEVALWRKAGGRSGAWERGSATGRSERPDGRR